MHSHGVVILKINILSSGVGSGKDKVMLTYPFHVASQPLTTIVVTLAFAFLIHKTSNIIQIFEQFLQPIL
jgi:hypothetical protein